MVVILGGAAWISASPRLRTSTLAMLTARVRRRGRGRRPRHARPERAPRGGGGVTGADRPAGRDAGGRRAPDAEVPERRVHVSRRDHRDHVRRQGRHATRCCSPTRRSSYFELAVPGGPDKGKVELAAGRVHDLLQHPRSPRRRHGGHGDGGGGRSRRRPTPTGEPAGRVARPPTTAAGRRHVDHHGGDREAAGTPRRARRARRRGGGGVQRWRRRFRLLLRGAGGRGAGDRHRRRGQPLLRPDRARAARRA